MSACEAQPSPVLHGALPAHLSPSLQGCCCLQPSLDGTPRHLLTSRHSAFHSSLVSTERSRAGVESHRSLYLRHIQSSLERGGCSLGSGGKQGKKEEGGKKAGREGWREEGRKEGEEEECSALKTLMSLERCKCCPLERK